MTHLLAFVAAVVLLAAPLAAQAQREQLTYRCTGGDGKKYYGSAVPPQCVGQPLELINRQGTVVRRIDPEGDEKQKAEKEAAAAKKREAEAAAKEAQRRSRALLATYSTEKEIEDARARALTEHRKQVQEVEGKIDSIKKNKARYEKELAMFETSDKKGLAPARLKEEITNAGIDLKAQESLLQAKKKEAEGINARYDEDKRRYQEATGKRPSTASSGK
jgi:hypothetical protein